MKAMVFAAGLGTRLRPLTETLPKALIPIAGLPMLEIVIRRLLKAQVESIIINVHHYPEKIKEFLAKKENFGIRIELSHEPELLDTGGGLMKAAGFFNDGLPFIVHNVDIISAVNLVKMHKAHLESNALATLAVSSRVSQHYLLFNEKGLLVGRESEWGKKIEWVNGPSPAAERLAFCGIHIISVPLFNKIKKNGAFSIIEAMMILAREGEKISAFRADDCYWADAGNAAKLEMIRAYVEKNGLPI